MGHGKSSEQIRPLIHKTINPFLVRLKVDRAVSIPTVSGFHSPPPGVLSTTSNIGTAKLNANKKWGICPIGAAALLTDFTAGGYMKFLAGLLGLAFIVSGCSTTSSVAKKEGNGTKQVYRAPFDQVWRAAVDAAQLGDLQILNASREQGYIAARRGVRAETFGENVGLWVKRMSPTETQVEVVSRQAGPPVFWLKNWEHEILRTIEANLTREAVGAGGTGTPSTEIRGSSREEMRQDAQRRISDLRRLEQEKEDAIAAEQSPERRTQLQTDIDRLRSERRVLEDYLLDLEVEGSPR